MLIFFLLLLFLHFIGHYWRWSIVCTLIELTLEKKEKKIQKLKRWPRLLSQKKRKRAKLATFYCNIGDYNIVSRFLYLFETFCCCSLGGHLYAKWSENWNLICCPISTEWKINRYLLRWLIIGGGACGDYYNKTNKSDSSNGILFLTIDATLRSLFSLELCNSLFLLLFRAIL